MKKALSCALVALMAAGVVFHTFAADQETKTRKPGQSSGTKTRPLPFHGTVTKVDPKAQTITVGKRVFQLNETTKLMQNDSVIALKDVQVGIRVGGSYLKDENGNLHALKLNFKGAEVESPEDTPAKKSGDDDPEK